MLKQGIRAEAVGIFVLSRKFKLRASILKGINLKNSRKLKAGLGRETIFRGAYWQMKRQVVPLLRGLKVINVVGREGPGESERELGWERENDQANEDLLG